MLSRLEPQTTDLPPAPDVSVKRTVKLEDVHAKSTELIVRLHMGNARLSAAVILILMLDTR